MSFDQIFEIDVNQQIIDDALCNDPYRCVLAMAVKNSLPTKFRQGTVEIENEIVLVHVDDFVHNDGSKSELMIDFIMDDLLVEWMNALDNGKYVQPMTVKAIIESHHHYSKFNICYVSGNMDIKEPEIIEVGTPVVAWCYNPAFAPNMGSYEKGVVKYVGTSGYYHAYTVEFTEHTDPFGRPRTMEHIFNTIRVIDDEHSVQDRKSELFKLYPNCST